MDHYTGIRPLKWTKRDELEWKLMKKEVGQLLGFGLLAFLFLIYFMHYVGFMHFATK